MEQPKWINDINSVLLWLIRLYLRFAFVFYPMWLILAILMILFAFAGDKPSFYEPNQWGLNTWLIVGTVIQYFFTLSLYLYLFINVVILVKGALNSSMVLENKYCFLHAFLTFVAFVFLELWLLGFFICIIASIICLYLHQKQVKKNGRQLFY